MMDLKQIFKKSLRNASAPSLEEGPSTEQGVCMLVLGGGQGVEGAGVDAVLCGQAVCAGMCPMFRMRMCHIRSFVLSENAADCCPNNCMCMEDCDAAAVAAVAAAAAAADAGSPKEAHSIDRPRVVCKDEAVLLMQPSLCPFLSCSSAILRCTTGAAGAADAGASADADTAREAC